MVLRVALPRRLRAVPARTPMTERLPPGSCLPRFAERTLILTFVPPLTFLKVENSALFAVVRTRRRTTEAPLGTATVTGTPVVATDAAVMADGAATRAAATRCVAIRAPAGGTATAALPAAAAVAMGGGGVPGSSVVGGRFCGFSSLKSTTWPPRSETTVTHWQVVTGITESRASTDHVWSARTSAVPIRRAGAAARPL